MILFSNLIRWRPSVGLKVAGVSGLVLLLGGCSSSSSIQQGSTSPVADSSTVQPAQGTAQTSASPSSRVRNQQGFVTQDDTIEAEVVTRNHTAGHVKAPAKGSTRKKFYSVQIGAFRELGNANRARKLAQDRYKKPVFHFYEKGIKMYRVTVGDFATLKEAAKFLKKIQEAHPKEYKESWVAEMRR